MFDPTALFERNPREARYHWGAARVIDGKRSGTLLAVLVVPDPFQARPYLEGATECRIVQDGWIFEVHSPVAFHASLASFLSDKRVCALCLDAHPCVGPASALEALDGLGAALVDRRGEPVLLGRAEFLELLGHAGPEFLRAKSRPHRFNEAGYDDIASIDRAHEAARTLGIDLGASRGTIVAAHRKLLLEHHPDRQDTPQNRELAAKINAARDVLLARLA